MARRLRVFLCYGREDYQAVRALWERLRDIGTDAWLDDKNLVPGTEWKEEVSKAMRDSDAVLVCLSDESEKKSGYVHREMREAIDLAAEQPPGAIFLIPLRLNDCSVPASLSKWHWVNYFDPEGPIRLEMALASRARQLDLQTPSVASTRKKESPDAAIERLVSTGGLAGEVSLSKMQLEDVMRHAVSSFPHECCGVLLGDERGERCIVREVRDVPNRASEPERRFDMRPQDLHKFFAEEQRTGGRILGFYYSHSDRPMAQPSAFTLEKAWRPYFYLIVAMDEGIPVDWRAWRLDASGRVFVPIAVGVG